MAFDQPQAAREMTALEHLAGLGNKLSASADRMDFQSSPVAEPAPSLSDRVGRLEMDKHELRELLAKALAELAQRVERLEHRVG